MLYVIENGVITAKHVSPDDIATSVLAVSHFYTGILPSYTLWYSRKELYPETALYFPPATRKVAVAVEAFKPPERYTIPTPGLIFICSPGQAPRVFAVKKRPENEDSLLFNAPYFNVYMDGRTCQGTQTYCQDIRQIPEEFFLSFFSLHMLGKRSKSHPDSLIALWRELDGKEEYPMDDLEPYGPVTGVL